MFGQIEFNEEEKIKLRKKLPIIGGLVVFAILISLYANTFKKDALQTIKETKNENLIYTVKERTVDGKKSEVPIINIEGENINKLNMSFNNYNIISGNKILKFYTVKFKIKGLFKCNTLSYIFSVVDPDIKTIVMTFDAIFYTIIFKTEIPTRI